MSSTVIHERQEQIGFISFNRPKVLNAVNNQFLEDFYSALEKARDDEQVKVVILKGKGRSFCAGADLEEMGKHTLKSSMYRLNLIQRIGHFLMVELDKPIIAAVHGYALGAGCEFAMNCDIRIAAEDAKFGFPEASVGGAVTNGGTQILPRLVGMGRAKRLIFSSDIIDARKAEEWGLVDDVVTPENLDKATIDLARKITSNSALAVKLLRRLIQRNADASFEEALKAEEDCGCFLSALGETQTRAGDKYQRMKAKK